MGLFLRSQHARTFNITTPVDSVRTRQYPKDAVQSHTANGGTLSRDLHAAKTLRAFASYGGIFTVSIQSKPEQQLTVLPNEAAKRLGIGRGATYALIHAGRLRALRVGNTYRIPISELTAFLERETEAKQ